MKGKLTHAFTQSNGQSVYSKLHVFTSSIGAVFMRALVKPFNEFLKIKGSTTYV